MYKTLIPILSGMENLIFLGGKHFVKSTILSKIIHTLFSKTLVLRSLGRYRHLVLGLVSWSKISL